MVGFTVYTGQTKLRQMLVRILRLRQSHILTFLFLLNTIKIKNKTKPLLNADLFSEKLGYFKKIFINTVLEKMHVSFWSILYYSS